MSSHENENENGGSPPPEQQDGGAAQSEHLNIKVTDNNNEVFFKIKRSTKLEKLMNAFCDRQGKQMTSVRFLFDGSRVQPSDTPDTVSHTFFVLSRLFTNLLRNNSSRWPTAIPSRFTRSRSAALLSKRLPSYLSWDQAQRQKHHEPTTILNFTKALKCCDDLAGWGNWGRIYLLPNGHTGET